MRTFLTILAVVAALFGVVACTAHFSTPEDPNSPQARYDRGEAILTSVAPDGTKLWKVQRGGEPVYFSTSGTQTTRTEGAGKTAHRVTVSTPNAI